MARLAIGLIFIVVPVLELALLVRTGQLIGFWPTLAIVMTTAVTGALILSRQGLTVMRRTLEAASQGRPPVAPVLDGMFLLVAGALLLTPGLITDVAALLLLVPPVRRGIARWMVRRLARGGKVQVYRSRPGAAAEPRPAPSAAGQGPVIEGEFTRLGEKTTGPDKRNGSTP